MKPIQTKFKSWDLTTPLEFDYVVGEDRSPENNVQLLGVYFKAAANITETVTITRISAKGATYTYLLDSTSLTTAQTVVYLPTGFVGLKRGDTLRVAATSATATQMVYVEIQFREAD
jgi:hypothetical protein